MNRVTIKLAKNTDATAIALLGRITFTETFGHLFRIKKELLDYYQRTFSVHCIFYLYYSLNTNSIFIFDLEYGEFTS